MLLLLTFLESQFEQHRTCAGVDSHKGFVQLEARSVLIQTGSCRGQQAIQTLHIVCIQKWECDITSSNRQQPMMCSREGLYWADVRQF